MNPRARAATLLAAVLLAPLLLAACDADTGELDLRRMTRGSEQNAFLACPPAYCAARADAATPTYPVAQARLTAIVRARLAALPRLTIVREDAAAGRIVAVQRSLVFRFPDTIWIETVPSGENQASLAIYSRATYGRSDFGVNRARVEELLAAIAAAVDAPT